jgi:hypothetical protein
VAFVCRAVDEFWFRRGINIKYTRVFLFFPNVFRRQKITGYIII